MRSGLEPADLDAAGQPIEPRAVDRDIPFQISAAAARAVQEGGGIRSAPTLLNLLQQATAIADRTELILPGRRTPGAGAAAEFRARPPTPRRGPPPQGLMVGLAVGGAIIVVALIVLASVLSRIFGDVGGSSTRTSSASTPPRRRRKPRTGHHRGSTVKPVRATVFSPEGEADAPDAAGLAIDGNPSTVWPTDTYSDAVPFPGFKNGVGLMLQLPQPTTLGEVTINVNSTGTAVQIRSAESPTPSSLEDTTELTPPTPLKPGSNTINVENAERRRRMCWCGSPRWAPSTARAAPTSPRSP